MGVRGIVVQGAVSGTVAESVRWLFVAAMNALGWGSLPHTQSSAVFIYGRLPMTLTESLLAELAMVALSALFGAGLVLLVRPHAGAAYRIKAVIYSLGVWLGADAAASLSHAEYLRRMSPSTEASNMLGALVWGLVVGGLLTWLNSRVTKRFPD